jgi:hypothetical protein
VPVSIGPDLGKDEFAALMFFLYFILEERIRGGWAGLTKQPA